MQKTATWTYAITCYLYRGLSVLIGRAPSIRGRENIPAGGCIVVANHRSIMDPWCISWCFTMSNGIKWMAKMESVDPRDFQRPGAGWIRNFFLLIAGWFSAQIVRGCDVLLVDREGKDQALNLKSLARASRLLEKGGIVGIFPEGGIDKKKAEGFFEGFISLAKRTEMPIVPIYIDGKRIVIGKPITFDLKCHELNNRARLAADVMSLIDSLRTEDNERIKQLVASFAGAGY